MEKKITFPAHTDACLRFDDRENSLKWLVNAWST